MEDPEEIITTISDNKVGRKSITKNRLSASGEAERLCNACNEWKTLDQYYAYRRGFFMKPGKRGSQGKCIPCCKLYANKMQRLRRARRNASKPVR